jgi:hypothetical protein
VLVVPVDVSPVLVVPVDVSPVLVVPVDVSPVLVVPVDVSPVLVVPVDVSPVLVVPVVSPVPVCFFFFFSDIYHLSFIFMFGIHSIQKDVKMNRKVASPAIFKKFLFSAYNGVLNDKN